MLLKSFKSLTYIRCLWKRNMCVVLGSDKLPKNTSKHSLIGIGRAYIDFTVTLDDDRARLLFETCNEFRNVPDPSIESSPRMCNWLFDELTNQSYPPKSSDDPLILPGGSTLNALRVSQWLLGDESATTFIGSVGDDEEGERLESLIELSNVQPILEVLSDQSTGKCVHISTEALNEPNMQSASKMSNMTVLDPIDSYCMLSYPGAADLISLSTLQQSDSRTALSSSTYILSSLSMAVNPNQNDGKPQELTGVRLLIGLSEIASSMDRVFCLRLPCTNSNFYSHMNPDHNMNSASALSACEWLELLSNVDILFTDLGSALDIAQTLSSWPQNNFSNPSSQEIRPDIQKRFAEFSASVLLCQKSPQDFICKHNVQSLFDPVVHTLAASMPGLAERLAFCLAYLPKKNGKKARTVVLMGSGSSSGGMVACTSAGDLYRLSDFAADSHVDLTSVNRQAPNTKMSDFILHGNGTGKCADAFVGGVLAKLMRGSSYSKGGNSLSEALKVGAKTANIISHKKACYFPKTLPIDLKLAMS